jgi:adenine-specific DNA-methyltransferase
MKELIKHDEIIFPQKPDGRPRRKKYLNDLESEFTGLSSILETVFNTQGTRELRAIFDDKEYFDFPKPVELIKILIEQGTVHHNDIILDFFSGSSTTAQAVLELNGQSNVSRKFLMVQLPEKCDENSEAFKAGFKTIADISKERIRRVIKKLEKEAEELKKKKADELPLNESGSNQPIAGRLFPIAGFKTFKLSPSTFKIWRGNDITEDNLITQLDAFTDPVREGSEKENMLYELILKSGYLLTDKVEVVSKYYSIKEGELKIVLNEINQKLVDAIISAKPKKVIMLDNLFTGYDQLKTNTVLQMKDAEIDFKTI